MASIFLLLLKMFIHYSREFILNWGLKNVEEDPLIYLTIDKSTAEAEDHREGGT